MGKKHGPVQCVRRPIVLCGAVLDTGKNACDEKNEDDCLNAACHVRKPPLMRFLGRERKAVRKEPFPRRQVFISL